MNLVERAVRRVDTYQQQHAAAGFVFGVMKKFGDDRAGSLAALITYYAFLALFPLLLLVVTILGFALEHSPELRHRIVHSALVDFPIIGNQLARNVHSLRASGLGLVISLLGLAWGSLGFTQAGQHAMAQVWNVPGVHRPGFFPRLARGASVIAVLGLGSIATTALSGVGVFAVAGAFVPVVTLVASFACDVLISLAAFRLLTPRRIQMRQLVPGAVLLGVAWSVLLLGGGYLVSQRLRQASEVYGLFAIVLGLLFWLYLAAQVSLYAAELNVVLTRRLYPRSIVQPPLTDADRRVLRELAQQEERRPEQRVHVTFVDDFADGAPETDAAPPPSSTPAREVHDERLRHDRARARPTRPSAGSNVHG
jgi:YihY family inner membrane protein